ncbi:mCG145121, partial [Mus musculus]
LNGSIFCFHDCPQARVMEDGERMWIGTKVSCDCLRLNCKTFLDSFIHGDDEGWRRGSGKSCLYERSPSGPPEEEKEE